MKLAALSLVLLTFAGFSAPAGAGPPTAPAPAGGAAPVVLVDGPYPIEVSISFSAALFHWLDSLTGLQHPGISAGKTIEAHRETFNRRFGHPDPYERDLLQRFGEIRQSFVKRHLGEGNARSGDPVGDPNALLVAFLDEPDLPSALRRAESLLEEDEHHDLEGILRYFAPRYEQIWQDGEIPREFVSNLRRDPGFPALLRLLVRIAAFFGVDPQDGEPSRLILVPVRDGYGTHAQANGRHLLIELRPRDELATTASVIVHENVHLLMGRIPPERLERLRRFAAGRSAGEAVRHLREALPTAMGQGVADRMFRWGWSRRHPWYHTREVDRYAKKIYPVVQKGLDDDATAFDEAFLDKLFALYRPRR